MKSPAEPASRPLAAFRPAVQRLLLRAAPGLALAAVAWASMSGALASSAPPSAPALQPLPALEVSPYMGRWYQVAYYPNFFQRQCVADTSATYRDRGDGTIEVLNRCRTASGAFDQVLGQARPVSGISVRRAASCGLPAWR